ncbi:hypothetical protein [Nostoc sp. FACHB-190]|uniref:hypothetical protein n=1 Tax=Nostoc sp. FACHB-190 TaxID=2692838 RepID=UPI0016898E37|nr:hypothetical protein [Nostoc sp. FACHB-190]MBD2297219.1 hypothetical protein [Nostoc sp. FACHB-190]
MTILFCKLRNNIFVESDIFLAERELKSFFKVSIPIYNSQELPKHINLPPSCAQIYIREDGIIGYVVREMDTPIVEIVKQLSFIQEIWCPYDCMDLIQLPPASWWIKCKQSNTEMIVMLPLMAAGEILTNSPTKLVSENDINELVKTIASCEKNTKSNWYKSLIRRNTSTPYVHNLHKYKAKFFPRMIRSFLVSIAKQAPRTKDGKVKIIDPFVGSGTALVEASLLNFDSIGIDIDKLSCLISQSKLTTLVQHIKIEQIKKIIDTVEKNKYPLFDKNITDNIYSFPQKIALKFEKKGNLEEKNKYEQEIAYWIGIIQDIEDENTKLVVSICLSDALSRKFNIRMMGTGVGRFALEIGKSDISSMVTANLKSLIKTISVSQTLIKAYNLSLGNVEIICDSATNIPLQPSSVSVILTSPPYLPASSGRENYLVSKAISIKALNLMSDDEIEAAEVKSVGSMKNRYELMLDAVPSEVVELYNWLKSDELRYIKATPTVIYYQSLKKALEETYRVLMPKGVAIYVIGKESIFYKYSTREVIYKVKCDEIFYKLAQSVGFTIQEKFDIELDKKNKNARPRSLDSYYESVFFLTKN